MEIIDGVAVYGYFENHPFQNPESNYPRGPFVATRMWGESFRVESRGPEETPFPVFPAGEGMALGGAWDVVADKVRDLNAAVSAGRIVRNEYGMFEWKELEQ